jgi:ribonuclease P protein component
LIGRIRDRRLFEALGSSGRPLRRGLLNVTYVPLGTETPGPLVAFAIGRRFGTAVERNRARRRLRAAFATAAQRVYPPLCVAILVRCRRSVLDAPFERLVDDATAVLQAIGSDARSPASC